MAFYSHDTMGLGHIRRNLAIARSLLGAHVGTALLLTGTREATAFALPPGCECLSLPSLMKDTEGRYQSRHLDVSLDEIISVRAGAIRAALASFAPDVLIVDKAPRGVHGELAPALELLRQRGNTQCVLGLRDVLDEPAAVEREWCAEDSSAAVDRYYDAIWVYGDPNVCDPIRSNPTLGKLRPPVSYTGYLCPAPGNRVRRLPQRAPAADIRALCLVGGGQDGAEIARAFADCSFDAECSGLIVAGPFMPASVRHELEEKAASSRGLQVSRFLPDIAPLIEQATHVVAMGGYNTVCELLGSQRRVLIVPRIVPRREQAIRADRLQELGLLDVLHPERLSARGIETWLRSESAPAAVPRAAIDLDGLSRLPDLVCGLTDTGAARARACS
jgi:predicted glycosyltransferase